MPRQLDANFAFALSSGSISPFFAAEITFRSATHYLWSGPWPLTINGQVYDGIGTLGGISSCKETIETEATGITISLSGIDNTILQECLDDIQLGAPATVYFGALDPATAQVIGQPCVYYRGLVDKPSHTTGATTSTISLAIESRMLRLQSGGQQRRYTSVDQRLTHPDDTFFFQQEQLSDRALKSGY